MRRSASAQADALRDVVGDAAPERIVLLRSFDPGAPTDLADPWTGGAAEYEACLDQIEAAADGVVEHVRSAIMRA